MWWESYGNFAPGLSCCAYPEAREVVKHYRVLRGLSRAALARKLGVKTNTVCRMELYGEGLTKISRLRELCREECLGIPHKLLGLCEPPGSGEWWISQGYPAFSASPEQSPDRGFPQAGHVVCHYRQLKDWQRWDLAVASGLSEDTVYLMEKHNLYLDAIARRSALRFLLGIPPVLLGLGSEQVIEQASAFVSASRSPAPELIVSSRAAVDSLFANYYADRGPDHVADALNWLTQVHEMQATVSSTQRSQLLEVESLGYQALSNITREYAPDAQVFAYSNRAISLAKSTGNTDLIAVALQRRAAMLFDRGYIERAQESSREVLSIYPGISDPALVLSAPMSAARILSPTALDASDRRAIFNLLDQAPPASGPDVFHLHHDSEICAIRTAHTYNLLALNAPQPEAEHLLRKVSRLLTGVSPDSARRAILANLELAQAALGLRAYDQATALSIDIFALANKTALTLYLPRLAEIYRALARSTYGTSPQVARLGLLLFEAGALDATEKGGNLARVS